MVNIFLSASIPLKQRAARYYDTADVIAIRDAVRALATVVIPAAHLFWGGHPSITPLIRDIMLKLNNGDVSGLREHVTIYQSEEYRHLFPEDNFDFEDVRVIRKGHDQQQSEHLMRSDMIGGKTFSAAIFIGGMEGVEIEYEMFRTLHPKVPVFPIASTGGAAKILYEKTPLKYLDPRLKTDYAYMSLFKDLLAPALGPL